MALIILDGEYYEMMLSAKTPKDVDAIIELMKKNNDIKESEKDVDKILKAKDDKPKHTRS